MPSSSNGNALAHLASLPHQSFGCLNAFSQVITRLRQCLVHLHLLRIAIAQPLQRINAFDEGFLRDLKCFHSKTAMSVRLP